MAAYLAEVAHARTENVFLNHISLSKRVLEYFSVHHPVDTVAQLRRSDCLAFLDWFTHKRGSFTPATYNMGVEFLRHLGRFCVARGWSREVFAADIPYQAIAVEVPTVLTPDEMARLTEVAEREEFNRMLVGLLGEVGLKKQELVSLRFADVELDAPAPAIVVRYVGKLQKKSRRLAVPAGLAAAMRRYVDRCKMAGTFNFLEPLVPITGRQVNNIIVTLCREAGVRRANPQILRDTAAVQMLKAARPAEEVGRQLGYTPRGYLLEFLPRFQLWIEPSQD
jgi:site-specific recombinase XerD